MKIRVIALDARKEYKMEFAIDSVRQKLKPVRLEGSKMRMTLNTAI